MTPTARVAVRMGIGMLIVFSVLAVFVVHQYMKSIQRSKEIVLRANLATTRVAIALYREQHGSCPASLQDLVDGKLLRTIPFDPIARSNSTWVSRYPVTREPSRKTACDIRSGAAGTATDGTRYLTW